MNLSAYNPNFSNPFAAFSYSKPASPTEIQNIPVFLYYWSSVITSLRLKVIAGDTRDRVGVKVFGKRKNRIPFRLYMNELH